jgi:hypothetical protein
VQGRRKHLRLERQEATCPRLDARVVADDEEAERQLWEMRALVSPFKAIVAYSGPTLPPAPWRTCCYDNWQDLSLPPPPHSFIDWQPALEVRNSWRLRKLRLDRDLSFLLVLGLLCFCTTAGVASGGRKHQRARLHLRARLHRPVVHHTRHYQLLTSLLLLGAAARSPPRCYWLAALPLRRIAGFRRATARALLVYWIALAAARESKGFKRIFVTSCRHSALWSKM